MEMLDSEDLDGFSCSGCWRGKLSDSVRESVPNALKGFYYDFFSESDYKQHVEVHRTRMVRHRSS